MKAMFLAFVCIGLIAVGASYGLKEIGWSSAERATSPDVRLE